MPDIIRHKKVSLNDLQEGEYVINEFGGQIKGVLKLNGRLHNSIFEQESNKAPLKSESNIVINDGISDRVIIGDIGQTKDGTVFGMKVSSPGSDARYATKDKLVVDSTRPSPVFFEAKVGSDHTQIGVTAEVVDFDTVTYDNLKGFDASTSLYTIPTTGIYFLYYNLCINQFDSGMTYAQIYMKDSDGNVFGVCRVDDKEFTADTAKVQKYAAKLVKLTSNKTVGIYYFQSGGADQSDIEASASSTTNAFESVFGGYLVSHQ
tara:strand:- start:95 stop:880 length:786 start_codon:yes stop_codon:yes gene_type:complete